MADWCRFNTAGALFIDPGSPHQDAWTESFSARLRDEHLNRQLFDSLLEAKVLTEDWRIDYNNNRAHIGLGSNPPARFAAEWLHRNQQLLAKQAAHQLGPSHLYETRVDQLVALHEVGHDPPDRLVAEYEREYARASAFLYGGTT